MYSGINNGIAASVTLAHGETERRRVLNDEADQEASPRQAGKSVIAKTFTSSSEDHPLNNIAEEKHITPQLYYYLIALLLIIASFLYLIFPAIGISILRSFLDPIRQGPHRSR